MPTTISDHRGTPLALVVALALALAIAGCGDDQAQSREDPEAVQAQTETQSPKDLWDRTFVSTAVTEHGEAVPLFAATRVRVAFEERDGQGEVSWRADCNGQGAQVVSAAHRLVLGERWTSLQGCADEAEAQDAWLYDFFDSNPRWTLRDDRLSLASDEAALELEERRR